MFHHQGAMLLQRAVAATPPPGGRGFESQTAEPGSTAGLYSSVGDRTAPAADGSTTSPPGGGGGVGGDGVRALTGCVLSVLIVSTLLGNTLVCAAVVKFRHLRSKVTNSFVISLAVSDLFVAVLVMPWRAASQVAGRWLFGAAFCDTWVACDIMCSTASILNLCVISMDRYWAISSPFRYESKMTRRVATTMIGLAWTLSVLISFIPVRLNWHRQTGSLLANNASSPFHDDQQGEQQQQQQQEEQEEECNPSLNRTYAISSSLISFYIPVAIMVGTYTRIFRIAQTQIRRISSLERAAGQRAQSRPLQHQHHQHHHHHQHQHHQSHGGGFNHAHPSHAHPPSHAHQGRHRGASNSTANQHPEESALKTSFKKETKVLKTLSIIMGVFVFCWLPFFVLNCVVPFCGGGAGPPCVSDATFSIFVWFGWANSSLNPVIYAFNADFRRAFSTILGCNKLCSSSAVEAVDFSNELVSYQHDTTLQKETAAPAGAVGGGAGGGAGVAGGAGGGGAGGGPGGGLSCLGGPHSQHVTAAPTRGEEEDEEEEEEEEDLSEPERRRVFGMTRLLRFECEAEISIDMMPFNSSGPAPAGHHGYPAIPGQVGDL